LDLIELLDLAPCFVAYRSGYIDFQSYDRHKIKIFNTEGTGEHRVNLYCSVFFVFLRTFVVNSSYAETSDTA
jgi:hypothetical protein